MKMILIRIKLRKAGIGSFLIFAVQLLCLIELHAAGAGSGTGGMSRQSRFNDETLGRAEIAAENAEDELNSAKESFKQAQDWKEKQSRCVAGAGQAACRANAQENIDTHKQNANTHLTNYEDLKTQEAEAGARARLFAESPPPLGTEPSLTGALNFDPGFVLPPPAGAGSNMPITSPW